MFQPLTLAIGLRYTRAKRRNHFISFISLASMVGIAVGVAALIIVISVMNGFEREMRGRILSMVSHATIAGVNGPLYDWSAVLERARIHPEVVAAAPYVEGEALVQGRAVSGALVRGIDPELEATVSDVATQLKSGRLEALKPGEFGVVIGSELSWKLGADLGDKITVYAPQTRSTPAGLVPTVRRYTVVGIFEVGMYEYDSGLILMHWSDAQRLYRMDSAVSGVRLKLTQLLRAGPVARELASELGGLYRVRDWTQQHANLFAAVKTERFTMFLILSLIVGVAAFNLVSTLVMVVTDKQADIAILRTLGLSPAGILKIFMVQGSAIGVVGTLLGVALGLLVAFNVRTLVPLLERLFGFEAMPGDIYYINFLPSEVRWPDVWTIAVISLCFSVLATLYPAWRASRTQPAEALRYE